MTQTPGGSGSTPQDPAHGEGTPPNTPANNTPPFDRAPDSGPPSGYPNYRPEGYPGGQHAPQGHYNTPPQQPQGGYPAPPGHALSPQQGQQQSFGQAPPQGQPGYPQTPQQPAGGHYYTGQPNPQFTQPNSGQYAQQAPAYSGGQPVPPQQQKRGIGTGMVLAALGVAALLVVIVAGLWFAVLRNNSDPDPTAAGATSSTAPSSISSASGEDNYSGGDNYGDAPATPQRSTSVPAAPEIDDLPQAADGLGSDPMFDDFISLPAGESARLEYEITGVLDPAYSFIMYNDPITDETVEVIAFDTPWTAEVTLEGGDYYAIYLAAGGVVPPSDLTCTVYLDGKAVVTDTTADNYDPASCALLIEP